MAGLRVVDLTRVLGGPYCTQILADHGADVVKVEPPAGDETRDWGPPFHEDDAAYFIGTNRNKRSVVLDLKQPAARAALLRLIEGADVLVHNMRLGAAERLGLSDTAIRRHVDNLADAGLIEPHEATTPRRRGRPAERVLAPLGRVSLIRGRG